LNRAAGGLLWEIRDFCVVAEGRSFVNAARLLGKSPSAITRAIQSLEEALGVELVARTTQRVGLTPAGERYFAHARHILELHAQAEQDVQEASAGFQGMIRFSAPEALGFRFLPERIAEFTEAHPGIQVDLILTDRMLDPLHEQLDFCIRGNFPQSSELIGYPLWAYQRHLYASPAYLARHGEPASPEALNAHALLVHTGPRVLKDWYFQAEAGGPVRRTHMLPRHRFSSGIALYQSACLGLGIARLANWLAADAVRRGELLRVLPDYRLTASNGADPAMHAVHRYTSLPRAIRSFLEHVRAHAPARPGGSGAQ
jgi:DNA-binding transcriptional LysR family regulator